MTTDPQKQIEKLTNEFAKQAMPLLYQLAIKNTQEAIHNTLSKGLNGSASHSLVKAASRRRSKRGVSGKRNPKQIERVMKTVFTFVKENPGSSVEAIGAGTSLQTKKLALPIRKLISDKSIRKTGEKRATKYFPVRNGKKNGG